MGEDVRDDGAEEPPVVAREHVDRRALIAHRIRGVRLEPRLQERRGAVPVEPPPHELGTFSREPGALGGVPKQPLCGVGQGPGLAGRNDQSRLAVDGVVARATVVRGDQGATASHRLHRRVAEALVVAGLQEHAAVVVDLVRQRGVVGRLPEVHPARQRERRWVDPEHQGS